MNSSTDKSSRENSQTTSDQGQSGFILGHLSSATTDLKEIPDPPSLPRLNYNLWDHKTKLFIVGGLLVVEASILPIALFYGLWFGTSLRHGILFAIITSFFGLVTGVEFALRSWKLILKDDTYRPLGGRRWWFDYTHLTLSTGYTIMTGILIGASIPEEPIVRALALPVPLFLMQLGIQMIWAGWMEATKRPAPYRISSVAKGERMVPATYTFIEDVVAVDGGAGKSYRERLRARYRASMRFRSLLKRLNWFWGVSGLVVGAGTVVVIWTVPQEIAYGLGWLIPLIFVSIWVAVTLHWIHRTLAKEKLDWMAEHRTPDMLEASTTSE